MTVEFAVTIDAFKLKIPIIRGLKVYSAFATNTIRIKINDVLMFSRVRNKYCRKIC